MAKMYLWKKQDLVKMYESKKKKIGLLRINR